MKEQPGDPRSVSPSMFARLPTTLRPFRFLAVLRGEGSANSPASRGPDARRPDAARGRARPEPAAAGRRVLVVDDEPSIRMLCSVNLGLAGFAVTEAENGAEALELAARRDFDLVLLDVMLPDIGGHEVARRLADDARTRHLPVVFLSARADRADLRLGYEVGGLDYITKPFDPVGLGARLDEVLSRVERGESESFRRTRLSELRGEPSS